MTPTFCSQCEWVVAESRKRHPGQWLCSRHKRLDGHGFVDPDYWSNEEPFLKCRDTNHGACPLFTPIREKQE